MKKVKIITDSCSDLSGELFEKYGIDYAYPPNNLPPISKISPSHGSGIANS